MEEKKYDVLTWFKAVKDPDLRDRLIKSHHQYWDKDVLEDRRNNGLHDVSCFIKALDFGFSWFNGSYFTISEISELLKISEEDLIDYRVLEDEDADIFLQIESKLNEMEEKLCKKQS